LPKLSSRRCALVLLAILASINLSAGSASADALPWSPERIVPGAWEPRATGDANGSVKISKTESCDSSLFSWQWVAESAFVRIELIKCKNEDAAASLSFQKRLLYQGDGSNSFFGENVDWSYRKSMSELLIAGRGWAQGTSLIEFEVACAKWPLAKCRSASDALSTDLGRYLAKPFVPAQIQAQNMLTHAIVTLPLTIWTILVFIPGLIRRFRRAKFSVPPSDSSWVNIDTAASKLKRQSFKWGVATGLKRVFFILAVLCAVVTVFEPGLRTAVSAGVFAVLFVVARSLAKRWENSLFTAHGKHHSGGWRKVAGHALKGLARLLLLPIFAVYLFTAIMDQLGGASGLVAAQGTYVSAVRISQGIGTLTDQLRIALNSLSDVPDLVGFIIAFTAIAALGIDRWGRSLLARDAHRVLDDDNRPHILYLRYFGDDKLKIRASRISRRGFLGRISPFHMRRFEEVVGWRLDEAGPLIALSDPTGRMRKLGAAKLSLPLHGWEPKVQKLAIDSLAVVVSAAPKHVRDGLMAELKMLDQALPHSRIILVIPPLPKRFLKLRWHKFIEAVHGLDVFSGIEEANPNLGAKVIVYVKGNGWTGFGGSDHSEWTYAASVQLALRYAVSRWEQVDPIESHAVVERT